MSFLVTSIIYAVNNAIHLNAAVLLLLEEIFTCQLKGAFRDPSLQGLGKIILPGIDRVPVLGPLLSGHSWIIYGSWLLVAGTYLLLFQHALGLRIRGGGNI